MQHTSATSQIPRCKCECGLERTGRSLYHQGHRKFSVRCRARWRALRGYARKRKIEFALTLSDVKELLYPLPALGDAHRIERVDLTRGFTPDNVLARSFKLPDRKRVEEVSEAFALSEDAIRQSATRTLTKKAKKLFGASATEEVVQALVSMFYKQAGRCPLSFIELAVAKQRAPESVEIVRIDPTKPWSMENLALVARALKPMVSRWGFSRYLGIVQGVMKQAKKRRVADAAQAEKAS
jgi:hypothetical protein